jgi:hypothetical protein
MIECPARDALLVGLKNSTIEGRPDPMQELTEIRLRLTRFFPDEQGTPE